MSKEQTSMTCFVICPIGEPGSDIRKRSDILIEHIIAPSVADCGCADPIRADNIAEPGIISTQVIEHLIEDDIVIADLTDHNANVFYELAIRHAAQKPVITVIKSGEEMLFDVNQVRTITYDNDIASARKCQAEITAQIQSVQKKQMTFDSPVSQAVATLLLRSSDDSTERSLGRIFDILDEIREALQRQRGISPNEFRVHSQTIGDLLNGCFELNVFLPIDIKTATNEEWNRVRRIVKEMRNKAGVIEKLMKDQGHNYVPF